MLGITNWKIILVRGVARSDSFGLHVTCLLVILLKLRVETGGNCLYFILQLYFILLDTFLVE